MTSESALWTSCRKALQPFGRAERVENRLGKGMPDVIYCLGDRIARTDTWPGARTGWLELKEADPPVNVLTPIRVDSLTLDQVLWAEGWAAAGGRVHMLLQLGRHYYLLPPSAFRPLFERAYIRRTLNEVAILSCYGTLMKMKLGLNLSR